MKPQLLFLDDETMRHDWADKVYAEYEVHHAYNFEQFKKALARINGPFDVVSFDHDIAGMPFEHNVEVTGLTCADWMIARPEFHPRACIVHSWNPSGAQRLVLALERAGFAVTRRMAGYGDR
ncbi:MAG TPA: cyclic-phosphate processing receiver domain-containing protein [Lacunisphaera sp.]|nr:cyclic-phosphate processing receiver domain-containing protein [Lacunisphaera sp.]